MKKLLTTIKGMLRVLFTPDCWIQNERYSAEWDKKLIELLENHRFRDVGEHTAMLGPVEIWIANRPYSSMVPWNTTQRGVGSYKSRFRARRITTLRAFDKLDREIAEDIAVGN